MTKSNFLSSHFVVLVDEIVTGLTKTLVLELPNKL